MVHFLVEADLSGGAAAAAVDGVDIGNLLQDSKVWQVLDVEQTMWKLYELRELWVPPTAPDPAPVGTAGKALELEAFLFGNCSSWDRPLLMVVTVLSSPHWDGIGLDF